MRAYVIETFGQPEVFREMELEVPTFPAGHVLIRVKATSINPVDYKIRAGILPALSPAFPVVLHGDVAGVIEAVGEGVTTLQIGDEVYACAGGIRGMSGALAELMLADATLVARKPTSASFSEAAALPLVSITAWEGLIDRAQVQSGQRVLVYGGTGGVGHIAIQLAKWRGAKVFATISSPEKAQIAKQLGADEVIDYRHQSVEDYVHQHTDGQGFDTVFDTVGDGNLQCAFQATKLNGQVVSTLALSAQDLVGMHIRGLSLHLVYMLLPMLSGINRAYHGDILTKLASLIDSQQIRPLIAQVFAISDIAQAHRYAESGQAVGKVVVKW